MLGQPTIVLICSLAAIVLGIYGVAALWDRNWAATRRRVQALSTTDPEDCDDGPSIASLLRRLVDGAVDARADRQHIIAQFAQAGIYRPEAVSWYFGTKMALVVLPLAIALAIYAAGNLDWNVAVLGGLAAAAVGSLLPNVWLERSVIRRRRDLRRALPDLLDLMIVCLDGGMSLAKTLSRVGEELQLAHPALAAELTIVERDVELGSTIDQALRRFAQRADLDGVRTLSTFVRETQRFGTRLTEALRAHADLLRNQREQAAEEKAQQASVKILMPTLLLILPAVFVVLAGPAVIQIQQAFSGK